MKNKHLSFYLDFMKWQMHHVCVFSTNSVELMPAVHLLWTRLMIMMISLKIVDKFNYIVGWSMWVKSNEPYWRPPMTAATSMPLSLWSFTYKSALPWTKDITKWKSSSTLCVRVNRILIRIIKEDWLSVSKP